MGQLLGIAQESHTLRQHVAQDLQRIWGNQQEIIKGLKSAEYNLRAQQKVVNDLMVENLKLHKLLITMARGADFQVEDQHGLVERDLGEGLILKEVEYPEGKELRVDWSAYHKFVDEDLAEIAEQERKAEEAQKAAEARAAEEQAKIQAEAPYQAQPQELPTEAPSDYPEGATIFGG
jgi:hypothetical protein